MKKPILVVVTGLACLSFLVACSKGQISSKTEDKMVMTDKKLKEDKKSDKSTMSEKTVTDDMVNKGEVASDFTLQDISGKTYQLSDLKGKKVYIKFWASWCSICLASLEGSNDLATSVGDDTIVLSVVSPNHMGEQDEASFKNWFAKTGYTDLPVLLDGEGSLLKQYRVRSYPTNVFIGSDGILVKTQVGFMDESSIEKTLAEIH